MKIKLLILLFSSLITASDSLLSTPDEFMEGFVNGLGFGTMPVIGQYGILFYVIAHRTIEKRFGGYLSRKNGLFVGGVVGTAAHLCLIKEAAQKAGVLGATAVSIAPAALYYSIVD